MMIEMMLKQLMGNDPDKLKKNLPGLDKSLVTFLELVHKEYPDNHHTSLMMNTVNGRTMIQVVNISASGKVTSVYKDYFTNVLERLKIDEVINAIFSRDMTFDSFSQMSDRYFETKTAVPTFEDYCMDMADALDNPKNLTPETFADQLPAKLLEEFNSGECTRLRNLLNEHYDSDTTEAIINFQKLEKSWCADWYINACERLIEHDQSILSQIDQLCNDNGF